MELGSVELRYTRSFVLLVLVPVLVLGGNISRYSKIRFHVN